MNQKGILFGAGRNGVLALKKYGKDKIAYFCDNANKRHGQRIDGIEIISFTKMVKLYKEGFSIIVTPEHNAHMIGQLELAGVNDYEVYISEEANCFIERMENNEKKFASENAILTKFSHETYELDLLKDVSEFSNLTKDVLRLNKEENLFLFHRGVNEEGRYYGNVNRLMDYAGIKESEIIHFPTVSHQDCFPLYSTAFNYKTAVIFPGTHYREKIHKRYPYVPVFSVGPYINYVDGIYSVDRVEKEKKKNGKTLLIFLPHTIENIDREYSRNSFIDTILDVYSQKFDKMMLCVYWADINDPVCYYAKEKGIHIVSAGFRFDMKFDSRLKTILELADAVVVGDIGTFIAYSLYMGIPIGRVDISDNRTITDSEIDSDVAKFLEFGEEYSGYKRKFYQLFDEELKCSEEQKAWMNALNGFDQVRDRDYIRDIFEICKKINVECSGRLEEYPEAVKKVYREYIIKGDSNKISMLKTAVGDYLS